MFLNRPFCIALCILILSSCCAPEYHSLKKESATTCKAVSKSPDKTDIPALSKFLKDTIQFDYLVNGILLPERLETICELNTIDKGNGWYEYKNGKYNYTLHVTGDDSFNEDINNSIFYDGTSKIEFKGKRILSCDPENINNYGLNQLTRLVNPKIVRAGKEIFLFSPLTFNCNGIGCGIMCYFIYHLKTKKATFINDCRYYISTPLLGDFNLDGTPDILVIEDDYIPEIKPFNVSGFRIRLIDFEFDNGSFKPKINPRNKAFVSYELTGLGEPDRKSLSPIPVSITENNWYSFGNEMQLTNQ